MRLTYENIKHHLDKHQIPYTTGIYGHRITIAGELSVSCLDKELTTISDCRTQQTLIIHTTLGGVLKASKGEVLSLERITVFIPEYKSVREVIGVFLCGGYELELLLVEIGEEFRALEGLIKKYLKVEDYNE